MTIELPEQLVKQLDAERERLPEIIARGLRRGWSSVSQVRREVIEFLARRPSPDDLLAFRPSPETLDRLNDLLARNQEGDLSATEAAELDELCDLDRFIALIKAEALHPRVAAA